MWEALRSGSGVSCASLHWKNAWILNMLLSLVAPPSSPRSLLWLSWSGLRSRGSCETTWSSGNFSEFFLGRLVEKLVPHLKFFFSCLLTPGTWWLFRCTYAKMNLKQREERGGGNKMETHFLHLDSWSSGCHLQFMGCFPPASRTLKQ